MGQDGIPASMELAWGLRDRPSRGPKRGLSIDQIVAAGVRLALTDGLAAVSMSRVAAELGAATMSLYRYVAAKDELLTLMVDSALGRPPELIPGTDWRTSLTLWANGVRAAYRRHPWALRVPITAPPLGPNNVAWLESALSSLAETPLSEKQKMSTVLLLSGLVRNESQLSADVAAAAAGVEVMDSYGATLCRLTDISKFPALRQAIAAGAMDDDDDPDTEFRFSLERTLDGIAALIGEPTRKGKRQGRVSREIPAKGAVTASER